MKLFFIDETGNYDQQQLVLRGGVVYEIKNYFELIEELKKIKFKYFGSYKKEIKWSDISMAVHLIKSGKKFNKNLQWLKEYKTSYLQDYLGDTVKKLCGKCDCIISSVSDPKNFKTESDMTLYHISDLMERYQFYLQEEDDFGVIIFDSINPLKDRYLKNCYQFLLENHNFVEKYDHIVDSLLSEISVHSVGIQSADYTLGVISGVLRNYTFSFQVYTSHLKNKIRTKNGKSIGYGIKVSPTSDTALKEMVKDKLGIK